MNEWREITPTEPLAYEPVLVSDGDVMVTAAKRIPEGYWKGYGWSGEEWEWDFDTDTLKYWMPLPLVKNEIKFKLDDRFVGIIQKQTEYTPTYRPLIDITKRFNKFLTHTTKYIEGMSIEIELEVDRYFRGEILLEKLLGQKVHNYILQFEKYEIEKGEYHYVPPPDKQEPEQKRKSSKLEKILSYFK